MIKKLVLVIAAGLIAAVPATLALALSDSAVPAKFPIPWAASAGGSYVRAIPTPSQIGVQNCAASLTDGFPPLTFLSTSGCGSFGQDFNGILKQLSQWSQWQAAGGPIYYDSAFSSAIGGYPSGSHLAQAAAPQCTWVSQVDNNTSDPDTGGANWLGSCAGVLSLGGMTGALGLGNCLVGSGAVVSINAGCNPAWTTGLTITANGNPVGNLAVDTPVATDQSSVEFRNSGTSKWRVGADSNASYEWFLYDATSNRLDLTVAPGGNMTLMPSGGYVVTGSNIYIGGGSPWADVKSGANGCPAAVGDGIANDRVAVQCQVTFQESIGGEVFFPCGNYLVNGGGIVAQNVILVGPQAGCAAIEVTDDETALSLSSTISQLHPGITELAVYCTAGSPATSCVKVTSGAVMFLNECTIQGGNWALEHHGVDGVVRDCYVAGVGGKVGCIASSLTTPATVLAGCGGNLYSDGSNWYHRDKFDQSASGINFCIFLTTVGTVTGSVTENSFNNTDCSGNETTSLVIYDNGINRSITTWYGYGPMSAPFYVISAKWTSITQANIVGGHSASLLTLADSYSQASTTISGAGPFLCSNNYNITC